MLRYTATALHQGKFRGQAIALHFVLNSFGCSVAYSEGYSRIIKIRLMNQPGNAPLFCCSGICSSPSDTMKVCETASSPPLSEKDRGNPKKSANIEQKRNSRPKIEKNTHPHVVRSSHFGIGLGIVYGQSRHGRSRHAFRVAGWIYGRIHSHYRDSALYCP